MLNLSCPVSSNNSLDMQRKRKNVTHNWKKSQSVEINPEVTETMEVKDKDLKTAIINIFKGVKSNKNMWVEK